MLLFIWGNFFCCVVYVRTITTTIYTIFSIHFAIDLPIEPIGFTILMCVCTI